MIKSQKIPNIVGKTVARTTSRMTWRGDEVETIILHFTDGSELVINPRTESGCSDCDPDGSMCDYLDFTLREAK